MYSSFGWRSSTIAPSALAPLQTLQPWLLCCCRWILLEACAVVTTHQHSRSDALGQLWGSFRRHRKHSASGHYQHYCLCAIQPLCSCSASLVQPRSIRSPYQRHVYADHLCSKLTARVYAVTTQKLKQSKGKKIHQVFQSHPQHELEQSEDGSVCINWVSLKEGHVLPMSYVSGLAVRLGDKETWDCLGTACLTWL